MSTVTEETPALVKGSRESKIAAVVEMKEIEVEEEITEWQCPESILALAKQDESSDE